MMGSLHQKKNARLKPMLLISVSSLFLFLLFFLFPTIQVGAEGAESSLIPGNTSYKKGVGRNWGVGTPEELQALGVSWAYNWYVAPELFAQDDFEYVPMIRAGENHFDFIAQMARTYPGRYWLIWNEPDYQFSDNLKAVDAAREYHFLRPLIKGADPTAKLIVGGVYFSAGLQWLTDFRNEYHKLFNEYPEVEGWHAHLYKGRTDYNKDEWRSIVNSWPRWMEENGGIVEFWLTEFGCLNSDVTARTIMNDQVAWLETLPWLTRYAWFATRSYGEGCTSCTGSLIRLGGGLNDLGDLYASIGYPPTPKYQITATANGEGTISPSGEIKVSSGESLTFYIHPQSRHVIAEVKIDGSSQGPMNSYTFTNISANHSIEANFLPKPVPQVAFAVNCGGPQYKGRDGIVYPADTQYSGGSTYATTAPIQGTEDDTLYQSERYGNFSYNIPLANGNYTVVLKLAEIYPRSDRGTRVFDVWIEGDKVIHHLDIYASAGKYKAYDVALPVTVSDGMLNIEFRNVVGSAKVSTILVTATQGTPQVTLTATAGPGGRMDPQGSVKVSVGSSQTFAITPDSGFQIAEVKVDGVSQGKLSSYTFANVSAPHSIEASFALIPPTGQPIFAVNCGGPRYVDRNGVVFQADTQYSGGSPFATTAAIQGTEDDVLYQTERYGAFTYNIPLPNGNYQVLLKFAEIYPRSNAPGKRIFNVRVEGSEVLSRLDLFAKTGQYKAYDVTIPVAVNDGVLKIEFQSVVGSAKVNAIVVRNSH